MLKILQHVCSYLGLILICVQVLLGRSDVSGWGAFLKVIFRFDISSAKERNQT